MKFKATILTIYSLIFLAACIGVTIYNYDQLSAGEGWGMVGMFGLIGFGVLLLVIDLVIQNIFKNKMTANLIGLLVTVLATVFIFSKGLFS